MSIQSACAAPRAKTVAAKAERVERSLACFRPEIQSRVRTLAARHPWLADLAISFPGLLFALAFPRRAASSEHALSLVLSGASLCTAAATAGVPMWLRRFPPEAFVKPIPELPDSRQFRLRVANHFPRQWRIAPYWLDSVSLAFCCADENVALWFAREAPKRPRKRKNRALRDRRRLVALWAWFSNSDSLAGSMAQTKWSDDNSWSNAESAALKWSDDISSWLYLGQRGVEDVWLEPGVVDGYEFVPLRTADELAEEGLAMSHCVRIYGPDMADNIARIWSIRSDGKRVATLRVGVLFRGVPYPSIKELAGPKNAPVDASVWMAARRWLCAQDKPDADPRRLESRYASMDPVLWRRLWRPYWLAKKHIPDWLPLKPTPMYLI